MTHNFFVHGTNKLWHLSTEADMVRLTSKFWVATKVFRVSNAALEHQCKI